MSSFENIAAYSFSQVMPTSFTPSTSSFKFNSGPQDNPDYLLTSHTVKNEPTYNPPHGEEAIRCFEEWQATLNNVPAASFLTAQHTTPIESPYPDFYNNFEASPYKSPFDTPIFDFDQETNLPPTPQYNTNHNNSSPYLDEGYNTGSSDFIIDFSFGFSPEQFGTDFSDNFADSTLIPPIEDIRLSAIQNSPMVDQGSIMSSPISTGSLSPEPSTTTGSPKRRRSDDESDNIGTRSFPCRHEGCNRVFARLFNLNTHMMTHDPNRDKPHVCTFAGCSKAFARKHDLYRHLTSVHDGLRDYKCDSCTKHFSRKDALRRHLAIKGCVGV